MSQKLPAISLVNSSLALAIALASPTASAECSYADAAMHNGWGWNPVESVSCPPLDACDYSDADIYGGWGWNPGLQTSCPPLIPTAGECIDSDGDGWGWDGVKSCLINEPPVFTDQLVFVDAPGIATAYSYALAPDGASSVFHYWGDDLYPGDAGNADVFLMDNSTGEVKLLSVGEGGEKANNDSYIEGVSEDISTVLVQSRATNYENTSANGVGQPFLIDVASGTVTQVLDNNPWSYVRSVLSDDGSTVAFSTASGNVVSDDSNGEADVFHFDVATRVTTRVSLSDSADELPGSAHIRDISADGRYVLYIYEASDQTDDWPTGLYVYDHIAQTNTVIRYLDASYHPATISADGSIVAYQYWHGNSRSVGWVNTLTGDSGRIDSSSAGYSSQPQVSPYGKYVAFTSTKTGLVDDVSVSGEISQIYLTELSTGLTVLVSQSPDGQEANAFAGGLEFTAGGQYIRFNSEATNLHSEDTDSNNDVFLYQMPAQ